MLRLWILLVLVALANGQDPQLRMNPAAPDFSNSPRVAQLIREGTLHLSLSDALELAIENSLDVQIQRYGRQIADAELRRTQGGGVVRGLNYTLSESPAGVGGPLSPVVTSPASGTRTSSGGSVSTNNVALGALSSPQANLSILGTVPQATGTSVPNFDPSVSGILNWNHQSLPQSNLTAAGTPNLVTQTSAANAGIQRGFSSGAQASLGYTNAYQSWNSIRSAYSPFTNSSLGLTFTQPLLRGFGVKLNKRFVRMAANEQKITDLLFRQQLILTVYGVIRLYTDFLALYEDRRVKEESLATAQKLYVDTKAQVEEGTAAPIELVRANALVFTSRQDLINATGLLEEQEAILKTVLTRQGNGDSAVRTARILPTDSLTIPSVDGVQPMQDLITNALANRPDLQQARLQVNNSEIGLTGTRNALLPQVDLIGVAQNNAMAGSVNPLAPSIDRTFSGGYGTVLDQLFTRKYPVYGAGIQVNLPLRNRVAEADYSRDQLQLRQQQVRLKQLENEARLEVEDALIAMRRARASYEAAQQARILQQQSLETEQLKFAAGVSTSYFVIQYENQLAQAKSTEVAAKSAYAKARAALQRADATILEQNGISVDATMQNGR